MSASIQQSNDLCEELRKDMKSLKEDNVQLQDRLYDVECDVINVDQYIRHSNIVICGIPAKVNQNQIEKHVLDILDKMGVKTYGKKLCSYDIVACHRLKKRGMFADVIVRFKDRNVVRECFHNKRKLNNIKNVFNYKYLNIVESLCRRTQSLFDYCKDLKKAGDIFKLWSYNGVVHVKFHDDNEEPTKLFHPDDINGYFEDSFVSSSSSDSQGDLSRGLVYVDGL